MIKLKSNSKNYKSLISYAIKTCTCASLVFEKNEFNSSEYFFQREYEVILESITKKECLTIHPDTGSCFNDADIIYFKLTKSITSFLISADNIFNWDGRNLPEELCFYRNGKVWLTCICHEKLTNIRNETVDDINFFKSNKIQFEVDA